jgi:hypothetical protein
MEDADFDQQMIELMDQIKNVDEQIEYILSHLKKLQLSQEIQTLKKNKKSLLYCIFNKFKKEQDNKPEPSLLDSLYDLGLGCWSNHLYYSFGSDDID